MKIRLLLLQLPFWICFPASVWAHEYWLEPTSFFVKPGESVAVRMFVGEKLKAEEERPFQSSKTSVFRMYSAGGSFDLISAGRDGEVPLFTFSSAGEGTYLLALERTWSYITLSPDEFENYLREEGMDYIIAERRRRGESRQEGKERYSRYLKSLIQVGQRRDRTCCRKTGQVFEIVPTENPYEKRSGERLRVQVFFRGRPLSNKTIFADVRNGQSLKSERYETDSNGFASLKIGASGVWLIRAVHMERCSRNCEGSDWQSFWTAMTFGVS